MGPIGEDEEGEKRLLPGDGPRKALIRGNTKVVGEDTDKHSSCLEQLQARSANAGVVMTLRYGLRGASEVPRSRECQ